MDPLSILSIAGIAGATAKAAWDIGTKLRVFFNDIKDVDKTVNELVAEVEALSSACEIVDQRLHDIVRDYEAEVSRPRAGEAKLWACIEAQVRKSQRSIAQLEAAFLKIQREHTNRLVQVWRQFTINIQAKDIKEARDRLRFQTMSLQTVLQALAMQVILSFQTN